MTKQETFDLKPGENLYKFTDREIQLIGSCLKDISEKLDKIAVEVIIVEPIGAGLIAGLSTEINKLHFSIENKEHSL